MLQQLQQQATVTNSSRQRANIHLLQQQTNKQTNVTLQQLQQQATVTNSIPQRANIHPLALVTSLLSFCLFGYGLLPMVLYRFTSST